MRSWERSFSLWFALELHGEEAEILGRLQEGEDIDYYAGA